MKGILFVAIMLLGLFLFLGSACGCVMTETEQHLIAGDELYSRWQFVEAIELDPEMAVAYSNRGGAYAAPGEFELAIDDYDEGIRLDPEYAKGYAKRAALYTLLGMDAEAQRDIDRALALGVDPAYLEEKLEEAEEKLQDLGRKTAGMIAK